jgi:hypothetical protein
MALSALDLQDLIELYAASSAVEADRLVLLLDEDGIEAIARATTMSSFPAASDAGHLVCVRAGDRARAKQVIEAARADGAVTLHGTFLDEA